MSELFARRYRIASTRLKSWDYSSEAMYFVTICTKFREMYFGEIVALPTATTAHPAALQPTEIGKVVRYEWCKTIEKRKDMNIRLGEFVVMPNHIHGIVMIGANAYNSQLLPAREQENKRNINNNNSKAELDRSNKYASQSKNLASVMRGFKSSVTTYARKNGIAFDWQPRYHEHIIRSSEEFRRITTYIKNNPSNWKTDKFYEPR
jgi:putative transposase